MTKAEIQSVVDMYFSSPKPKSRVKRPKATRSKAKLLTGAGLLGAGGFTLLNLQTGNAGLAYAGTAVCVSPLYFMLVGALLSIGLVSLIGFIFS